MCKFSHTSSPVGNLAGGGKIAISKHVHALALFGAHLTIVYFVTCLIITTSCSVAGQSSTYVHVDLVHTSKQSLWLGQGTCYLLQPCFDFNKINMAMYC